MTGRTMRLSELVAGRAEAVSGSDPEVSSVVQHTDDVAAGSLFCCVRGAHVDGHDLAGAAAAGGATALVVDHRLDVALPQVVVPDVRRTVGPLAARLLGEPSRAMTVVGITGTNGKTTTVAMLRAILAAGGRRCETIGTLSSSPTGGPPTTPEASTLQRRFADWRDDGLDAVAMEVSSHALSLGRVDGTWFAATGFTGLGTDHLDHHGSLDAYFAAKADLFSPERTDKAVIRLDDEWGARLAAETEVEVRGYTLDDAADLRATPGGSTFVWRGQGVALTLPGRHNVANALGAATIAEWLGLDERTIATGLSGPLVVPGRFERVDEGQGFTVAVDYAHTPDALAAVLAAAREQAGGGGRVIVVFGCGGDRDKGKRPEMGRVAASLADVVVVTSDNPRSEDPSVIVDHIVAGLPEGYAGEVVIDPDRRSAIHHAAREAGHGDVVVIAGKGHETTQTFGDRTVPFDDRAVASDVLRQMRGARS